MEQVNEFEMQSNTVRHRKILITGLMIAMLFGALEGTIVGTAMPRIVGELGGLSLMIWLTTAYMLTSTTIVPIAGKLADLLGRRVIYVTGLVIFMVGSALCGMADNMTELIIYRGLQGIGGGIMMPMAMIVIGDVFTGKERAKWQGVFGGLYGLASVIGPQVGGFIVDHLNWRWVFYINLPVGILATIFIAMGLSKYKAEGPVKFDLAGMFTMVVGVVSLLLALTFGGDKYEWTSWQIIALFAAALVFLTLFVFVERKAEEPILPMHLFKHRTFTVLNGIGFLMSVGMFGAIMFVPFFMQGVVGVSATKSGTIMTPMMITMIIGSIVGGRTVYKIGVKSQLFIGMAIMAAGFGLLSTMDVDTSEWTATLYMIILGLGMGLVMPLLTLALQESFPKSELGVVTSSSQFFRSIGGTFGMTILGAIMNHRSSQLLDDRLMPMLQSLPVQAKGMVDRFAHMIHDDPQGLYSILLSPEALEKIPPQMRETFVPILKQSLVDSLHSVFLFGLIFVIGGTVLVFGLKNIKLSDRQQLQEMAEKEKLPQS
ncbi:MULTISPECIES: MDR family MFS transporter [unclassified Geobacillus]|uniref:MDR family MFS transporter n=1 Tax=unclassified Geobacillus TaxID=2642459 RepID=UPI000BE381D6|nr:MULTISPECIES: MDR family MFS transporter [unclassified Geobacillus]PDM39267.1 MFS transporter [Parageobacillus yumthangensis]PUF87864.1 MFS transporter [Geobacillus sp. LYN3]RDV21257.1 DHA2 family efflux MFS transporter permease subunit [Parageobacillus toebii]TXK86808.1 MFS transporter [Geobacillus sp. AYS3]